MRRDIAWIAGAAMVGGALLTSDAHLHAVEIAVELLIFYLLQKGLETFERAELSYAPIMVFTSAFFVGMFGAVIGPSLTWYALAMTVMDALLSFVLTLVFIQAVPVFTYRKKHYQLRGEEILCLVILLASS
ncbi:hypothetical protein HMSSN139_48710 [Paenibacillus sp. HMSSN-139]|nr:hypothetical protein HMSSN139_48710 [Paenibacillus sp. HMSSN-139]